MMPIATPTASLMIGAPLAAAECAGAKRPLTTTAASASCVPAGADEAHSTASIALESAATRASDRRRSASRMRHANHADATAAVTETTVRNTSKTFISIHHSQPSPQDELDRKSTRLNSSHLV